MITSYQEWKQYLGAFASLYELCFHQPMDIEEVKWRYFQNPQKDVVACFAFDQGELVANYSVSPVSLFYRGKVIKAAQSLNTMTHPNYMGKGLFVALATEVYLFLKHKGYELVWGFPNYISNRTFLTRLDWKDVFVVPTIEVSLEKLKNHTFGVNVVGDDKLQLDYTSCLSNHDVIQVNKSNEYLYWRYVMHPHIEYKVFAYSIDGVNATSRIICKEYKDILNIVDYSIRDNNELEQLLSSVIAYANSLDKNKITIWAKLGDVMHLALEAYGAKNTLPITYFGVCLFHEGMEDIYMNGQKGRIHMSDDNVY